MTDEEIVTKDNLLETLIEVLKPFKDQCKNCDGSGVQTYWHRKHKEERTRDCWCNEGIVTYVSYEQEVLINLIRDENETR